MHLGRNVGVGRTTVWWTGLGGERRFGFECWKQGEEGSNEAVGEVGSAGIHLRVKTEVARPAEFHPVRAGERGSWVETLFRRSRCQVQAGKTSDGLSMFGPERGRMERRVIAPVLPVPVLLVARR